MLILKAFKLKYNKLYNNFKYEISFTDIHLNKNDSKLNFGPKTVLDLMNLICHLNTIIKKSSCKFIYTYRDKKFGII